MLNTNVISKMNDTNEVVCRNCGLINDYRIVTRSNNRQAYCNGCGNFIKNIPHAEPMLYVGKYKSIPIKQIQDLNYLQWAIKTMKLSSYVFDAIEERIDQLQKLKY